ncbi:MAG: hypothetical protein HKN04_09800 [Rhodothermaceae bacterium]|nr:hypothetical protein [Rhodothermaceae bacterium]
MTRLSPSLLALLIVAPLGLTGCFSVVHVRIQNVSPVEFHAVELGDTRYGDVPVGTTTAYKPVRLVPLLRYADLRLTVDGHRITGTTLMHGHSRFTHRVNIVDLEKGHLDIEVIRERDDRGGQRSDG